MPNLEPGGWNLVGAAAGFLYGLVKREPGCVPGEGVACVDTLPPSPGPVTNAIGYGLVGYLVGSVLKPDRRGGGDHYGSDTYKREYPPYRGYPGKPVAPRGGRVRRISELKQREVDNAFGRELEREYNPEDRAAALKRVADLERRITRQLEAMRHEKAIRGEPSRAQRKTLARLEVDLGVLRRKLGLPRPEGPEPDWWSPARNPPQTKQRRNPNPGDSKAAQLYQDFHGASPATSKKYNLPTPTGPVMEIGRVIEIVYQPEKPSTLAGKEFQHAFGDTGLPWFSRDIKRRPILATDGKDFWLLRDKSRHYFSERGIIA